MTGTSVIAKTTLLRFGAQLSEKALHYAGGLFDYVELGWWLRTHGFRDGIRVRSPHEIFERIAAEVADQRVHYVQFGAVDPAIVRYWSQHRNGNSSFQVFAPAHDRSTDWIPGRGGGHKWSRRVAAARGAGPQSNGAIARDDRLVDHAVGDFESLFAAYDWPPFDTLIAVFDTDFYPTTKSALDFIGEKLSVGSFLFFDQLNHCADELRALDEFLRETRMSFELFAAVRELSVAAFRRTG